MRLDALVALIVLSYASPTIGGPPQIDRTAPSPAEIEKQVIANRSIITSGEVELVQLARNDANTEYLSRRRVTFDANRVRCDTLERTEDGRPVKWTQAARYITNKSYASYQGPANPTRESPMYVEVWDEPHPGLSPSSAIPDMRVLGLYPMDSYNLIYLDLSSYLTRKDRDAEESTWVEDPQGPLLLDRFTLKDGQEASFWVNPAKGYAVVRSVIKADEIVDEIVCDVEKHADSGLYFPTHYVYTRSYDGKETSREDLTIDVISLNKPIDGSRFELASLGIPVGTPVYEPLNPRPGRIWDGHRVIDRQSLRPVKATGAAHGFSIRLQLSLALFVLACIFTALFIWLGRRKRRGVVNS